jgi:hypothetical protein
MDVRVTRPIPRERLLDAARQNARAAATFARLGDAKNAAKCRKAAGHFRKQAADR